MAPSKDIPSTVVQWTKHAEEEDIQDKPIHEEELVSASKITWRQYLLLHVLWKRYPRKSLNTQRIDLETWMGHARELLKNYDSYKTYRDSFRGTLGEGNFFLAKVSQLDAGKVKSKEISNDVIVSPVSKHTRQSSRERREQLNETPTKPKLPAIGRLNLEDKKDPVTPSTGGDSVFSGPTSMSTGGSLGPAEVRSEAYPRVDDEQLVNIALVNFLKALTDFFPSLASSWTIHRKPLKAKFKGAEYEARTDGYLRGKADGEVRALIEVKVPLRVDFPVDIRMQESAQMVAWLKDSPEIPRRLPFRRFHVSQDRQEIWLSFAEYDQEYKNYLESGSRNPGSRKLFP